MSKNFLFGITRRERSNNGSHDFMKDFKVDICNDSQSQVIKNDEMERKNNFQV